MSDKSLIRQRLSNLSVSVLEDNANVLGDYYERFDSNVFSGEGVENNDLRALGRSDQQQLEAYVYQNLEQTDSEVGERFDTYIDSVIYKARSQNQPLNAANVILDLVETTEVRIGDVLNKIGRGSGISEDATLFSDMTDNSNNDNDGSGIGSLIDPRIIVLGVLAVGAVFIGGVGR